VGFGVLSSKDLGKTWNRKIELRGWTVYALPTIDSSNFVHFSVIQSLSSGTVEHHLTYNVLLDSISYSEPPKAGEGRRRIFFANKRRFGIRDYFDGNYSESFDGGVTWSQPKEWGLRGTRWFPRTDSSLVGHSELDVSEAYIRPRVSAIEIDSTKLDRIAPVWVWSIAPNPVNGLLRIDLSLHGSSSRSAMRMAIVDMLGNVVGDLKPLLDSLAINQRSVLEWEVPPELPAGAYVLVFGDDTWRKSMMIAVTR
jgi:hypothetical protein